MTTRRELTEAVGERYRHSDWNEKRQILDEFIQLTGYHRKHAIRVLCREMQPPRTKPARGRRYNDEVRAALITLWEAGDRICGKRLKALIPTLIDAMTRCGHLSLSKELRERLMQVSAATIDRLLRDVREQAFGGQRMREAQRRVAECSSTTALATHVGPTGDVTIGDFLASLGTAWQAGEVRPTHRRKARVPHDWRTREDPFEHTWPKIQQWLETEPGITAKRLQDRLIGMAPTMYSSAQLRTLQRRVKAWRADRARELITRILDDADATEADDATQRQPLSPNNSAVTITRE